MENNSIIITNNLIKRFPMGKEEFTALRGISLHFGNGEFAGLIGPSGSGKTTLLNILGSLDVPSEGEALVLGRSIGKLNARQAARLRKENIGFIFQSYNLLAVHTVYENVEFPLLLLNLPSAERHRMTMEALEWVGLTDKIRSKPPQLSGGQCQRVAIARAMVKKPSLVLADEPTANLDASNSHHILQTMETLNRELKTTFIFATHDEKVISYLHRKIFLLDGRVDKDEIIRSN
ncbi:ABC transporter ATP-binding protein [Lentimicrobium sp.]|uniref:ABC transporter ATP-binding protein n=1 Tax=Lentimicrobium sp. TaxID=2034841 RepID=UPI002C2CFA41|nr:ABC transporter ATP-binding protein [Lentimicrobium sp.]HPF64307.1 ABC transporter ATP-binding protein [Lentimicrobium sp.]